MFAARCDRLGRRVLMSLDDLLALERVADGFRLHYRCLCGDLATCIQRSHRSRAA